MGERTELRGGAVTAIPLAVAVGLFGVSFGVLSATTGGMGALPAIVMSATTFAGSAQFAAASILSAGGQPLAAIAAALLLNARYVPIGVSVAPFFSGGPLHRFMQAQLVVDESWAIENVRVSVTSGTTGVGDAPTALALTLSSNAPNPFSDRTMLRVGSPRDGDASVDVFDVSGRRVRHLQASVVAGWQEVAISGVDDHGRPLASGVYFCRVAMAGESTTRKIVISR